MNISKTIYEVFVAVKFVDMVSVKSHLKHLSQEVEGEKCGRGHSEVIHGLTRPAQHSVERFLHLNTRWRWLLRCR